MTLQANMHPADVSALVTKAGGTLSALAKAHRKHPSTFWHCLRRCIPEANRAVAKFLGKAPGELWPEWFDERGNRRNLSQGLTSHKPTTGKSQNSGEYADGRRVA